MDENAETNNDRLIGHQERNISNDIVVENEKMDDMYTEYENVEEVEEDKAPAPPHYNLRSASKRNYSEEDVQFFIKEHGKHGVRMIMNEIRRKLFDVCYTQIQAETGIKNMTNVQWQLC